jgi:small ligand-binding sensory domain FIST
MKTFPYAHATHPQWRMCAGLVIAQLKAQMALPEHADKPSLGIVYFTDHYAQDAQALLDALRQELPLVSDWAGTVGVGIASNNVEYFDEPALAVMLCDLPRESYRVFSGVAPLAASAAFQPHSALVHADGRTPDLAELLGELAGRTRSGYLFGGLAASRQVAPQIAWQEAQAAQGVWEGGLSGVAFNERVALISRVTQGCQPIVLPDGKTTQAHRITQSDRHVVLELDGQPALDVMLEELGIRLSEPAKATQTLRQTFVGLTPADQSPKQRLPKQRSFDAQTRVRHLVGLDPLRRGFAVADHAPVGSELTFCERHAQAARRDLMRICAEIREELAPEEVFDEMLGGSQNATDSIALSADSIRAHAQKPSKNVVGAIYMSCAGRGGPHFGGESAELQIVRHALGDVPLVGFFAGGEIAHQQVYGYTGVLTVFTADA